MTRAQRHLADALVLVADTIDEWDDTRHPAFADVVRAHLHLQAALGKLEDET